VGIDYDDYISPHQQGDGPLGPFYHFYPRFIMPRGIDYYKEYI
jgi:hypothetical protein